MDREFNRENLQAVYRMLFEMAKGNFNFQIERTNHHDELEGLALILNMTAQKLKKNRNQFLWLNKNSEFVEIQTTSFLLDSEFKIVHLHSEMEYFKGKAEKLLNTEESFSALLTEESKVLWNRSVRNFRRKKPRFLILPLHYSFYKSLDLRLHSVITKISFEKPEFYVVYSSQLRLEKDELFNTPKIKRRHTLSIWDQQLFQDINIYITNHLEQPLISNHDLASLFNTNEHKIKVGFKEACGLTPFQLHRKKRIEYSKLLITNTELSLTEIALKMRFSTYPQFSKTFKMVTGKSPRSFKKSVFF